jgi:hypothetical protein
MSIIGYLRKERYKMAVDIAVTATGFLLALLVNSAVDDWKEKSAYDSLVIAIKAEAASNEVIYTNSFQFALNGGVVFRGFSTTAANIGLSNIAFLNHASSNQVAILSEYLRDLTLSNLYREKSEKLRFANTADPSSLSDNQQWDDQIKASWTINLIACSNSIKRVEILIR